MSSGLVGAVSGGAGDSATDERAAPPPVSRVFEARFLQDWRGVLAFFGSED
jgi:hypothetical protein